MKKIWLSGRLIILVCLLVLASCQKNHAPVIQDVTSSSNDQKAGTIFSLTVTAIDEDGDILQYQWTADGGEFTEGTSGSQTKWKSPADGSGKTFNVSVAVSDGKATANRSYQIKIDRNNAPAISSITSTPKTGAGGGIFSLKVVASDPDNDPLTYKWTCTDGEFPDGDNQTTVNWKSPVSNIDKKYNLRVEVTDGVNLVNKTLEISVSKSLLGTVVGSAYFSGCKIPIAGVTISVAGKTATTGSDGKFRMVDVPAGTYTLEANKTDYDSFFKGITVTKNMTTTVNISMTSQRFTSKVYGNVKDQDGLAISGAIVVILNPDKSESELRTTTSATGYYQLPTVPQGERTIVVKKLSYQMFQSSIFIVDGDYEFDIRIIEDTDDCVDPDGRSYKTVQIGDQLWMAENLAYLPAVSPSNTGSDSEIYYYVYGFDGTSAATARQQANYTTYGVLYNWPAAMNGASGSTSVPSGVQGICPDGWHLPSDAEWTILTDYLGTSAGKKMKSTSGWANYGNGDNSSGFNAPSGGYRYCDGGFYTLSWHAHFWSSSESGSNAWSRYLHCNSDGVARIYDYRRGGFSVRCLKN